MKNLLYLTITVILLICNGCGRNLSLRGTVTFSDNGDPITGGVVVFSDGVHEARGPIQKDGSYIVGFEKDGNGLPPGKYNVYLTGTSESYLSPQGNTYSVPVIDSKYENADTSKLHFTVDGSTKNFDIKVDRPPKNQNEKNVTIQPHSVE